ncbi:MAG: DsbA family protein [Gemmatimonadetes bacterium]|nr:DsbA family protein [Gemmatimonadota bacterium]
MNRTVVIGSVAAGLLVGLGAVGLLGRRGGAPVAQANAPGQSAAVAATAPPSLGGQADELMLAARTRGADQAPIVIYEVSDFQCPFCRQFWAETLPALEREYINRGKVRLTFINFPIPQLHANAQAAHEVAMCAAQQDKFWRMHDLLYQHQGAWAGLPDPGPYFLGLADSARADRKGLETCLGGGRIRQLVQGEAQASWNAGVRSTPSFIVQGLLMAGTAPIGQLRPILDSIYAARTEKR